MPHPHRCRQAARPDQLARRGALYCCLRLLAARRFWRFWRLAGLVGLLAQAGPVWGQLSGNPILPGYHADPEIGYFNQRYYLYVTTNEGTNGEQFHAFSSTDLAHWCDEGVIFDLGPQCTWTTKRGYQGGWAPAVAARHGQFYFYYTAQAKIGVAVGSSPTGPFTDIGHALVATDPYTTDIIDPMVFVDDDGQAYLYYGGSNGSRLVVRRLNPDMVSLAADPPQDITPPNYTEGPYLLKRNGLYYIMYSNGSWTNETYNVQYATSPSPTGPWAYRGTLLSSNDQSFGPGHHSILKIPECDDYYIVYHRYLDRSYRTRRVAVDDLLFNRDGTMQQVRMTTGGVAPRTAGSPCR